MDLIWPEAKANTRDMKGRSRKTNFTALKGDITEMLQDMEELCNGILAEGESHQDFAIDLLSALAAVQDNYFPCAL